MATGGGTAAGVTTEFTRLVLAATVVKAPVAISTSVWRFAGG